MNIKEWQLKHFPLSGMYTIESGYQAHIRYLAHTAY